MSVIAQQPLLFLRFLLLNIPEKNMNYILFGKAIFRFETPKQSHPPLPLEWRQGPDSLQVFAAKLCNVLQSFLLLTAQHAEWLRVKVLQQGQLWRDKKHVIVHNRQDLSKNYLEGALVPERPWWSSSPRSRGRGRCWSTPALLYRWA